MCALPMHVLQAAWQWCASASATAQATALLHVLKLPRCPKYTRRQRTPVHTPPHTLPPCSCVASCTVNFGSNCTHYKCSKQAMWLTTPRSQSHHNIQLQFRPCDQHHTNDVYTHTSTTHTMRSCTVILRTAQLQHSILDVTALDCSIVALLQFCVNIFYTPVKWLQSSMHTGSQQ